MQQKSYRRTGKRTWSYIAVLLTIWFVVSYVCGILIVDQLDAYTIGGFPLGFWFANQGSLVTFVVLIWVYVWLMDRLDIKYDVQQGLTLGPAVSQQLLFPN